MRKLGLIGGMSWVSNEMYYERISRKVQRYSAAMASAPILIESLDVRPFQSLRNGDDWGQATQILIESARRLESAGAEALMIGANSMHRVYDEIAESVQIPVLHIADYVGKALKDAGHKRAALLGTRNVMTEAFYRMRLVAHGIDLLPPHMGAVDALDTIIYDELRAGKTTRDAERKLKSIITHTAQDGADCLVLGCSELALVVDVDANVLPVFDSTRIHCDAAAAWILSEQSVD